MVMFVLTMNYVERKMVVGSGENKKDVDVNEAQEPEPVIEKTFEGGFFTISSPKPPAGTPESFGKQLSVSMGTPLTPFSALPRTLRTPNRHGSRRLSTTSEASFRRASLSILGVRKSMGSFNKVIPTFSFFYDPFECAKFLNQTHSSFNKYYGHINFWITDWRRINFVRR